MTHIETPITLTFILIIKEFHSLLRVDLHI